jgi:hypothetical protein
LAKCDKTAPLFDCLPVNLGAQTFVKVQVMEKYASVLFLGGDERVKDAVEKICGTCPKLKQRIIWTFIADPFSGSSRSVAATIFVSKPNVVRHEASPR